MKLKGTNSYSGALLFVLPLVVIVLLAIVIACEDDSTRPHIPGQQVTGEVVDFSDCGGYIMKPVAIDAFTGPSCIMYEYSDTTNTLEIRHQTSMFNCCIDSITAEIAVIENVIVISEDDVESAPCDCICPYDVDMEISNLPAGYYLLIFTSPYLRDPIQFTINLGTEPSGYYCVDSTVPTPTDTTWGAFIGFHGCGIPDDDVVVPDSLQLLPLVTYEYADNTLRLGHHNMLGNCCPDNFMVLFSVEDNVITITEIDSTAQMCDCLCPNGLDAEIYNLPVGQYEVVIFPPWGSFPLEFSVDLEAEPSGYYCPIPWELSKP